MGKASGSTIFALVAICALAAPIRTCGDQASQIPSGLREVSVDLPGSPNDVKGIEAVQPGSGLATVLEPNDVTIHLGDGTSWSMKGRSTYVLFSEGRVMSVDVSPLMQPVPYSQLKANLFKTLADLQIDSSELRRQLSTWGDNIPSPGEGGLSPPYRATDWRPAHGVLVGIEMNGNPRGWYYSLIFSAVTRHLISVIAPATEPSGGATGELRDISVKLTGASSDVNGVEVKVPGRGMGEADFLFPQRLAVHSPDGPSIVLTARSSNLFCFDGVVQGVFVRRPMRLVSFKEAKADMLRTLAGLNIKADNVMSNLMSNWPDDEPNSGDSRTDCVTGVDTHGMELTIRLCPDPAGGWYYLLIFDDQKSNG